MTAIMRVWPSLVGWTTTKINEREKLEIEFDAFDKSHVVTKPPPIINAHEERSPTIHGNETCGREEEPCVGGNAR